MSERKLSKLQRATFCRAIQSWVVSRKLYRAQTNGERVTLASLWRYGLLDRVPHRGADGDPDAAYEYGITEHVDAAMAARKRPSEARS